MVTIMYDHPVSQEPGGRPSCEEVGQSRTVIN